MVLFFIQLCNFKTVVDFSSCIITHAIFQKLKEVLETAGLHDVIVMETGDMYY